MASSTTPEVFAEPPPRWGHCSAVIDGELFIYGGSTEELFRANSENGLAVYTFNQITETWHANVSTGEPPPGLLYGACATLNHCIYHYGGGSVVAMTRDALYGDNYGILLSDALYRLDTDSLEWSKLPSGPKEEEPKGKDGCGMISYQENLYLFGGYGYASPGATYLRDDRFIDGGWTNELHLYNTQLGEC